MSGILTRTMQIWRGNMLNALELPSSGIGPRLALGLSVFNMTFLVFFRISNHLQAKNLEKCETVDQLYDALEQTDTRECIQTLVESFDSRMVEPTIVKGNNTEEMEQEDHELVATNFRPDSKEFKAGY
jgi:hypothetical protein